MSDQGLPLEIDPSRVRITFIITEEVTMKAQVKPKARYTTLSLFLLMCFSLGFISSAHAHYKYKHHHKNIPVAYCTTSGTGIPMIPFVCCKVGDDDNDHGNGWHHVWAQGGCGQIDDARYSRHCSVTTPVYGMNGPIVGDCQFSHSTHES